MPSSSMNIAVALTACVLATASIGAQSALYTYPSWTMASPLGDVNGDGVADLIAGPFPPPNSSSFAVISGRDGAYLRTLSASMPPLGPIGDLDGDGRADIAVVNAQGGVDAFSGRTGAPLYTLPAQPPDVGSVAGLGDIDGDGRDDLIVGWQQPGTTRVEVFSGATGSSLVDYGSESSVSIRVTGL